MLKYKGYFGEVKLFDYLDWCKERGEKPEKTYSGNIRLRMNPDLHAYLALEAARSGVSLNSLINERLNR